MHKPARSSYTVHPTRNYTGILPVSGAKNSILPCLIAGLLTKETIVLNNVPELEDVTNMLQLLNHFGSITTHDKALKQVTIQTPTIQTIEADKALVNSMRASILSLGALLARAHEVKLYQPGGDAIGKRPIDLHIEGFKALNAQEVPNPHLIHLTTKSLTGGEVNFPFSSVGATQNVLLASVLAKGLTVIRNASIEPEITDLCELLQKMGANIEGVGTSVLRITGVSELKSATHTIIPDRIEMGTFMVLGALGTRPLTIVNGNVSHLGEVIRIVECMGVQVEVTGADSLTVYPQATYQPITLKTEPYPFFPTDMQSQLLILLTQASGVSYLHETIYEDRFKHVDQLVAMGANIVLANPQEAIVKGKTYFKGGLNLVSKDLRSGMSLVLASLLADSTSIVNDIYHIERGYEHLVHKLGSIGITLTKGEV